MFDGPDYGPFCIAPFVAFYVGLLVYGIGMSINTFLEKKFDKKPDWWKEIVLLFSIILVPVACITSIGLGVGEANPAPWFDPTVNNIAGKWILIPHTILELAKLEDMPDPASELVFYDDGTFIASEIPDRKSVV